MVKGGERGCDAIDDNWEHLIFAKKPVVGWRSLCGASDISLPRNLIGSETLPLPIYVIEMLPDNFMVSKTKRRGK